MSNNLSVWHKLLLLVLVPLSFELVFVISLGALLRYAQEESDRYEQSKELLLHFHMAESCLMHTTSILMSDSNNPSLLNAHLDHSISQFRQTSEEIRKSATIRPELKESLVEVPELFEQAIGLSQRARKMLNQHGDLDIKRILTVRNEAFPLLIEFQRISKDVLQAELKMVTVAPEQLAQIRFYVVSALVVGTLTSAALSALAAYVFTDAILLRLKKIESNARLLGMRAPLSSLPIGNDEIGVLSKSLQEADRVLAETRSKELAILDVAADVICSLDRRYRFTAIGAAAVPSWGYPLGELLGESLLSLQAHESKLVCRAALDQIAQSGKDGEFESELLCKNGNTKDILWKVSWLKDKNNFYCVAHDISERRAADRMKQRFIAIVSHDLRTPLSSISATLSLLNRGARGVLTQEAKKI